MAPIESSEHSPSVRLMSIAIGLKARKGRKYEKGDVDLGEYSNCLGSDL
jgi:hypothetical protein